MSEEKNIESESEEEQLKFDQEQYKFLIECSKKGPEGIDEWNEWREENPNEEIWLEGAEFRRANLQGADLIDAKLQGAKLGFANLEGANLYDAKLQGAELSFANLQGAEFRGAILNGDTSFLACEIDEDTDFRHTGLENVRIKSGTKILLKYNVRRMNWEEWYAEHKILRWLVRPFWLMSDYGRSTGRIMLIFFGLSLLFAAIYLNLAFWWDIQAIGGSGEGFTVEPHLPLWHYRALIILRPIYFSVVTMTTLGFGDMYANAQSIWGHILLTLQVIMGYVLLGALVTRLAVLFTSDGPAGKFTPMDKETKELLAKLKEDKEKAE